jgi:hypothetical protein
MMKSLAAAVGMLVVLQGSGMAYAAGESIRPFPDQTVPLEIARKRVVSKRPFVVGDLKPLSDRDAESLLRHASNDTAMLEKCVETSEGALQWSQVGRSLEIASSSAAVTNVTTAYCDDNIVLLGGSRQEMEEGVSATWIFYWSRMPGQEFGPMSLLTRKASAYTLNELKAIDPVSRQLLFSGTAADGRELLLAARFAIVPRR